MNKKEIILVGAGGHSRSCIDVIEREGKFKIKGLIGLDEEVGNFVNGYEVLTTDSHLSKLLGRCRYALIAIGQILSPEMRIYAYEKVLKTGFQLATIVAPTAYVSRHAQLESGTIVMHGAIVNSGVKVGENCIINTNVIIEHQSQISKHCHISTGVIVNGGVSIGESCFIGSGTIIREGISIGSKSIVGMSSSIRNDIQPGSKISGIYK